MTRNASQIGKKIQPAKQENRSINEFGKKVKRAAAQRVFGNTHNLVGPKVQLEDNFIFDKFSQKTVAFGSCFARYIFEGLEELGLNCYHEGLTCRHFTSRSLLTMFRRHELGKLRLTENELAEKNGMYVSRLHFAYNKRMNEVSRAKALDLLEKEDRALLEKLLEADVLILTLGTATYLRDKTSGNFINNAAGLDVEEYEICRLSVNDVVEDLREIFEILQRIKPKPFKTVITVSPQRYGWLEIRGTTPVEHRVGRGKGVVYVGGRIEKDGLVYNNGDKARVRAGLDEFLMSASPELGIEYFPSYDIIMDELRQHESFLTADLLHVSQLSVAYVLDRFIKTHCTPELLQAISFRREWNRSFGDAPNSGEALLKLFQNDPEEQLDFAAYIFSNLARHMESTDCSALSKDILGAFSLNPDLRMKSLCEKFAEDGTVSFVDDIQVSPAEPELKPMEKIRLTLKEKDNEIRRLSKELEIAQRQLGQWDPNSNLKNVRGGR